jgi:hypothetical protein
MSALPTKADMRLAVQKCPLSAKSGHRFASATVRPNQNVDEFDEASTIQSSLVNHSVMAPTQPALSALSLQIGGACGRGGG